MSAANQLTIDTSPAETFLLRLAEVAEVFNAEHIVADARSLSERLSDGRFYVACIRQFKRGKSSVLNALVCNSVLPTGVVPVTTVPTVVRYGVSIFARIRFDSGAWTTIPVETLDQYVSEEKNPENSKHVTGLEVFVPSALLATGMCFVDTPGLGSVFTGNTEATREFIPHIDAALVVIGADPPLTGEELALVEAISKHTQEVIVVLNKADRTTDTERHEAIDFAREHLEKRLHRPLDSVFEISAAERLEHSSTGRDWNKLVHALTGLVDNSAQRLIRSAGERGLKRIGEQLLTMIFAEREALQWLSKNRNIVLLS